MPIPLLVSRGFARAAVTARPQMSRNFAEKSRVYMGRFVKGAGFVNTAIGLAELKRDWNKEVEIKGKMVTKSNFEHASDIFCLSLDAASNVAGIKGALFGLGGIGATSMAAFATPSDSIARQNCLENLMEGIAFAGANGLGLGKSKALGTMSDLLSVGLHANVNGPRMLNLYAEMSHKTPEGTDLFVLEDFDQLAMLG